RTKNSCNAYSLDARLMTGHPSAEDGQNAMEDFGCSELIASRGAPGAWVTEHGGVVAGVAGAGQELLDTVFVSQVARPQEGRPLLVGAEADATIHQGVAVDVEEARGRRTRRELRAGVGIDAGEELAIGAE